MIFERREYARGRIPAMPSDGELRKTLYEVMQEVRARPGAATMTIKETTDYLMT
jgi:hypothetical protein